MSNRQFAAAHDRYLDPPDDDGEETWDEMDLDERIWWECIPDREDFEAEYYHQRHPPAEFDKLPWKDEIDPFKMSIAEKIGWTILFCLLWGA